MKESFVLTYHEEIFTRQLKRKQGPIEPFLTFIKSDKIQDERRSDLGMRSRNL